MHLLLELHFWLTKTVIIYGRVMLFYFDKKP